VVRGDALPADLAGALRTRLAPHELPRRIAVVAEIATGPAGKVDRAEMARRVEGLLQPLV